MQTCYCASECQLLTMLIINKKVKKKKKRETQIKYLTVSFIKEMPKLNSVNVLPLLCCFILTNGLKWLGETETVLR